MATDSHVLNKIEGTGLKEFFEAKRPGRVSVLVQVRSVNQRFTRNRDNASAERRWHALPRNTDNEHDEEAAVDTVRNLIHSVTSQDPRLVRAARAFVADVNFEELREIALSEAVASVSLNRKLR